MATSSIFCNLCGLSSAADAQFCQGCGSPLSPSPAFPVASPTLLTVPHYAGFWIRVLAAMIDTLVLFSAAFPLRLLLGSAVTLLGMGVEMPVHEMLLVRRWVRISVGILAAWAYQSLMDSSRYQATLGKIALRLKVTDLDGHRISFGRATARYFAKFLSGFSLGIGYLMVGFDEQKQGLHDRIAGTLVQCGRGSL